MGCMNSRGPARKDVRPPFVSHLLPLTSYVSFQSRGIGFGAGVVASVILFRRTLSSLFNFDFHLSFLTHLSSYPLLQRPFTSISPSHSTFASTYQPVNLFPFPFLNPTTHNQLVPSILFCMRTDTQDEHGPSRSPPASAQAPPTRTVIALLTRLGSRG